VELVRPGSSVTPQRATGTRPTVELLADLFDDAAMYPPGDMPLPEAVAAHLRRRSSAHAFAVGPFVCGAAALGDVADHAARLLGDSGDPFRVSVIAPDVGTLDALRAGMRPDPIVTLVNLEVPFGDADLRQAGAGDVPVYVERPVATVDDGAARRLAERGLRLKMRTGGLRAEAFPTEAVLSRAITAAVRAGLAFKCTAGLHHAVRYQNPTTGFEHHGFLNVILATALAAGGGDDREVLAAIALREPRELAARIADLDTDAARSARTWFRSFGTCSIDEPWADLRSLALVDDPAAVGGVP
jgi:hypothetical protein